MNKHLSLLPRMAANNIRKNGQVYFPYLGVSIFAMFTYFVFDLVKSNDIMDTLPRAVYVTMLVGIGFSLLGIIMIPFLYYTNSFLIKRRKKELGLYSILGLEKKHIGIMMLYESLIMYVIVVVSAIVLGLIFSKLIFLLLLNLAKMPVEVEFGISIGAITDTLGFYAFITGLNLLVNLIQVGKANPVELMSDSKRGEKEPKLIWLWSVIGVAALVLGYQMAVNAQLDSMIFTDFFLAVFLVIIGTYFLFTSGSIASLRFLKGRKKFYYRPENFITISGMLYRMKKSAASLSNICIFSTMVIITVVCTTAVYMGMDVIVASSFSREIEIYYYGKEWVEEEVLREGAMELAKRNQIELQDVLSYSYVEIRAFKKDNAFLKEGDSYNYSNWKTFLLMTEEEYNLLEGTQVTVRPGEILLLSEGADYGGDSVYFEEREYQIQEELKESKVVKKVPENGFADIYVVVFADREELDQVSQIYGVDGYESRSYLYGFLPEGVQENIDNFSRELEAYVNGLKGFAQYKDYRELMKEREACTEVCYLLAFSLAQSF